MSTKTPPCHNHLFPSPLLSTHPVPLFKFHILLLCEFYSLSFRHTGTSVHLLCLLPADGINLYLVSFLAGLQKEVHRSDPIYKQRLVISINNNTVSGPCQSVHSGIYIHGHYIRYRSHEASRADWQERVAELQGKGPHVAHTLQHPAAHALLPALPSLLRGCGGGGEGHISGDRTIYAV